MPPHLMNFQSWLAAQGLSVMDGIVQENNITDNAADAWNDSLTLSDSSSSASSGDALIIMENADMSVSSELNQELLSVSVDLHSQGIRFALSNQANQLLSLLLAEPVPRQQLNLSIYNALRPYLASMGPWRQAYGVRTESLHVEIQISAVNNVLQFTQLDGSLILANTNTAMLPAPDVAAHSSEGPLLLIDAPS